MKKNKVIRTLLSLILFGFLGKGLSMIARILMTRELGTEAMSIYTLANPAMVLIITLAQMGIPTAIATLISKKPEKSKKIFVSGLFISLFISVALMIVTLLVAPYLASNVLKNEDVTMTIYGLALLIPLVSLSSLLKGYFIGHNLVKLTAISSIAEEIMRIVFILLFLGYFSKKGPQYASFGAMMGVCVGEIFQSLYLVFQSEKKLYRRVQEAFDLKQIKPLEEIPGILSLSLPITLSRIISSLTYFFEPIIVTNLLMKYGVSAAKITLDYGILNGYAMPILMLPCFFALALANFLLPNMSAAIGKKQYSHAQKLFYTILLASIGIGLSMALLLEWKGNEILHLLYKTDEGAVYVKWLALPFILYYVETPIGNAMHALGLTKKAFISTILSCMVRIVSLVLLTKHYQIRAVAISTLLAIFTNVTLNLFHVFRAFLLHNKKRAIAS